MSERAQTLADRVEARIRAEWPGTHVATGMGVFEAPRINPGGRTDALVNLVVKIVAEEQNAMIQETQDLLDGMRTTELTGNDLLERATDLERAAKALRRRWRAEPGTPGPSAFYPTAGKTQAHEDIDLEEIIHAQIRVMADQANLYNGQWTGIHLAPGERVRVRRSVVLELTGAPKDA